MSDYAIVGRKRTGKSLIAVAIIRDALVKGKRVATNLNLNLDHLMHHTSIKTVTRLPDHPTVDDLEALGRGQPGVAEEDNGILVLDEVSHFWNARQFQDKGRLTELQWLTQSGKEGWDVYYIMQGLRQLDAQVRETQIEYLITIKRTDKWPIPFLTPLTAMMFGDERALRFPKMRLAITRYGIDRDSMVVSRKFYFAKDLYPCYETQQKFLDSSHPDACGMHTMLSAWHLKGRYMPSVPSRTTYLKYALYLVCIFAQKITRTEIDTYRILTRSSL
jgi:hypothetical protein